MQFGPRTLQVSAFVDSLSGVSASDWGTSVDSAYRAVVSLEEGLDRASMLIAAASNNHDLWDECIAAESAARGGASHLGFDGGTAAARVAGAIVVMDHVPLADLAAAFLLFRETSAVIPVNWTR